MLLLTFSNAWHRVNLAAGGSTVRNALGVTLKVMVSVAALVLVAPESYAQIMSWDKVLSSGVRFRVLSNWGGSAVLDRETGLVWEQSPDLTSLTWSDALARCINKFNVLGKLGWRLPTIEELGSLTGPIQQSLSIGLPTGHPFNVGGAPTNFWSSTTSASDSNSAWWWRQPSGPFLPPFGGAPMATLTKSDRISAWCVRGGHGYHAQ
jgi:hypothetical protein